MYGFWESLLGVDSYNRHYFCIVCTVGTYRYNNSFVGLRYILCHLCKMNTPAPLTPATAG